MLNEHDNNVSLHTLLAAITATEKVQIVQASTRARFDRGHWEWKARFQDRQRKL